MSYRKAMKHAMNPRKFKMTATRIRGNRAVFGEPSTKETPEQAARRFKQ